MAKQTVLTGNSLTKKLWEEKLFKDTLKESYFSKFMGDSSDSLVQVKTDLEKSKGDSITFGIRMRLAGKGVTSNQTLEGNEETLTTYSFPVSLEEYAHAVRDAGPLDRQRPIWNMETEMRDGLKGWGGEKIDQLCFDAIASSPSKIFYGGTASSTATLAAGDKVTPALISKIKTWAITGGARSQTPLRPIRINGKDHFVLLVHPDVMFDLKRDSEFTQARREALERGKDNPIFSGAEAIFDGVVIHEHENIPIVTTWGIGGNVPGAQCVMMGAQSLTWAWGKRPDVVARDFDYGREHGYAWMMMAGVAKPKFNNKDYGSLGVYVARTNVAGS